MVTKHYIDGNEVDKDDLDDYACHNCGVCIKDYKWGFREDAHGYYYCDSKQECREAIIDNMAHIEYEKEEEE